MDYQVKKFWFGHDFGAPYCLESRSLPSRLGVHLTLSHQNRTVSVEDHPLRLLALFFSKTEDGYMLSRQEIIEGVWMVDQRTRANVDTLVGRLRELLGDSEEQRFIETLRNFGYRFKVVVREETVSSKSGAASAITVLPSDEWRKGGRYLSLIGETTRGQGSDEEGDLRIWTTYFTSGVPDVLRDLLDQNVRIKILFLKKQLIRTRNRVRLDGYKPPQAVKMLGNQLDALDDLKKLSVKNKKGKLEVLQSDVFPCGFVAHNSNGALLGVLLSTESYARGPLIEIGHDTELWRILKADFLELWQRASAKTKHRTKQKQAP